MTTSQTIGWTVAFGIVAFVTVSGNVLTFAVFFTCKKLLHMRASYFLINLAAADLLVGAVAVPMYIVLLCRHLDNVAYQNVYTTIDIASGFASVFTLTAIGMERFYAAFCPLRHRNILTETKFLMMVGLVWFFASVIATFHLLFKYDVIPYEVFFSVMMSMLTACLFFICVCYSGIWIRVKYFYGVRTRDSSKDKKLLTMLLIITTAFVVTWLPFHLLNIINFFCNFCFVSKLPHNALFFCKLLHYANSCLNPIIYSLQMPNFRIALGRIFSKDSFARGNEAPKIEEVPLENIGDADDP